MDIVSDACLEISTSLYLVKLIMKDCNTLNYRWQQHNINSYKRSESGPCEVALSFLKSFPYFAFENLEISAVAIFFMLDSAGIQHKFI